MPVTSRIKKAKANEPESPVKKRQIPIIMSEIKMTLLAPNRAAINPPMTASKRYPIKLPVPIRPTCVYVSDNPSYIEGRMTVYDILPKP